MKNSFRTAAALLAAFLVGISSGSAQEAPASGALLTDAQVREKYRNCPEGYYNGPRPGIRRYTKDEYLWVVTPEFAAAYCMPPEFVDKELKGAEAVAYKPVREGAEHCGFGGNREACGRRIAHGFEIYYKSSLKLPSKSETQYNYPAFYMLESSKHLLSSHKIMTPKEAVEYEKTRPGRQNKFRGWALIGVKGTKPVWPIAAYREIQYIEELLPGYNYTSIEGSMGFFTNPRYEGLGVRDFVLRLNRPGESRDDELLDTRSDYAHVIHLPRHFLEKIRVVDKQGALAFDALLRNAMSVTPSK